MNADILRQFLNDPAWDAPFFKRLAHNDTGHAVGHQGGVVIPKELRPYFPTLDESAATAVAPTVDRHLQAEMFIPSQQVAVDVIRYQLQTWGGTRRAESRITDNLGPIRNRAHEGDFLIMQRSRDRLDSFRLFLVRKTDAAFARIDELAQGRRWGALIAKVPPISQDELSSARSTIIQEASEPFVVSRTDVPRQFGTRSAIARDTAFRGIIIGQYDGCCCVSGIALRTPTRFAEVEAVHVVPLGRGGADEPRNGLALTSTLHWAFDRGLFAINAQRRVAVPLSVRNLVENKFLAAFDGKEIKEARDTAFRAEDAALRWHSEQVARIWS
jgi:putative restriction endonuclease